jgi:phospholipase/lecithinase/hemolysin
MVTVGHGLADVAVVTALLVFGDSLCDGGNARALLGDRAFPSPPHWANRRCNGPLWVEGLAAGLGLAPLVPSLAGGTNHAFGGARSGRGFSPKGAPNLLTQVEEFSRDRAAVGAGGASSLTLVVLRAGANDYLDAPPGPAVGETVNAHLLEAVRLLGDLGLRRFLVPHELPWGSSPIDLPGFGEPERHALNGLIRQQNGALQQALQQLAAHRGLVVVQPDFHGLLLEVQGNPGAWGFQEVRRPALTAGTHGIPDAGGVLWWDAWGHLTTAFHQLLAERALGELIGKHPRDVP